MKLVQIAWLLIIVLSSCQNQTEQTVSSTEEISIAKVPDWTTKAIWYQIFVERFRNGDPTNDQTREDIIGTEPSFIPADWSVTAWGHDWYKHESWLDKANGVNFHHNKKVLICYKKKIYIFLSQPYFFYYPVFEG